MCWQQVQTRCGRFEGEKEMGEREREEQTCECVTECVRGMGRGYRLQNFIFCFLKNGRKEGEKSKKSYAITAVRVEKLVLSKVSRTKGNKQESPVRLEYM